MRDPRVEQYARILLEQCLTVEAGQQVLVFANVLARPLVDEVTAQIARKGAYALVRLSFNETLMPHAWVANAPEQVLDVPAPIEVHALENADAVVALVAPENTREGSALPRDRVQRVGKAYHPAARRMIDGDLPWVGCQFPCPALAQDAGMSVEAFADFLYGACLRDWEAERERMRGYADLFDAASEVRIVGAGTDLRLSLEGRRAEVDAGGANMPGGEFFFSPVEDSAEGEITFSEFPASHTGRDLKDVRLRFEGGRVVDFSAASEEAFLAEVLDTDEGARRIGELGIGCNPGITRYMRNTLFDEKIDGTVHIALGAGFPKLGGSNESTVHWDIVKDLRDGGRIELDGRVVQENGVWKEGVPAAA